MRILLVSNLFPPYAVGGYERLAAWVAEGLRKRGHAVHVLTGRGPAFREVPDVHPDLDLDLPALRAAHFGAGIAFAPGLREGFRRHVWSLRNFRATRRAVAKAKPDLLSFWNPAFITFSPLLAARHLGVPSIVHLSDTTVNPFRNPHAPALPPFLQGAARGAVDALLRLSRPRRLVVPSAFLREKFVRREGLPADRVTVLPWPLPPALEPAPPDRPQTQASRLLFVGSLAPEKGTRVLLDAFREAWSKRPELTLTLVGGAGREVAESLRQAAEGLPVSFRGQREHAEVLQEYARHDVLVFPSVWDEPFALVPLEAAAIGLAIIATTAGGTTETLTDDETARLVPPGDRGALVRAMVELVGDPSLVRRLAASARAHVLARHAFTPFLERLEGLYEECRSARTR